MHWVPLGDQAVLVYCADEAGAANLARRLRQGAPPWLVDVVQAYASVGVFFNLLQVTAAEAARQIEALEAVSKTATNGARVHAIPCCYELHLDLPRVAEHTGLS